MQPAERRHLAELSGVERIMTGRVFAATPRSVIQTFYQAAAAQLMRGRNSRRQREKRQADEDCRKHTDQVNE
jgi:hypothetical protein